MSSGLILLIYTVMCYGLANTLIYARGPFHIFDAMHKIANKIHPQLEEMLSCFICLDWWIGFLFGALDIFVFTSIAFTPMGLIGLPLEYWYVSVFLDGAFTSGAVWLINTVQDALERSNGNGGDD